MQLYKALMLEINEHEKFWNYYEEQYENILETEEGAENFIKKYFEVGSKACMVTFNNSEKMYMDLENMGVRMIHTANTFFIGVFLQRIIDDNLAIKLRENDSFPFAYLWYLTCFAHDLGYAYENKNSAILKMKDIDRAELEKLIIKRQYAERGMGERTKRIASRYNYEYRKDARRIWYRKCGLDDIEYTEIRFGLQSISVNEGRGRNIEFNNGIVICRPWYSHRVKNNYFLYRLLQMNVIDHGIIGGDIFFSKMKKNYELRNKLGTDEFWDDRGNYYCIEQKVVFAYIADCIISHNIFIADHKTKELYEKYELQELMPNEFKRISYRKNPLLFILGVADTLEPSKRFLNERNVTRYTNKDLLQMISIDYNKVKNEVTVSISKELFNSDEGEKYKKDIETMEKWCEIKGIVKIG